MQPIHKNFNFRFKENVGGLNRGTFSYYYNSNSVSCHQIVHHVHPVTGVRVPYLPHGPLPDVLPQVPTSEWSPLDHTPWWLDPGYVVGYLSANPRPIRVMNVLTKEEITVEVKLQPTINVTQV